jgi:hypothetical protein
MKKRIVSYWPFFNIAGIIFVLWSLSILNVNPELNIKKQAMFEVSDDQLLYNGNLRGIKKSLVQKSKPEMPKIQKKAGLASNL